MTRLAVSLWVCVAFLGLGLPLSAQIPGEVTELTERGAVVPQGTGRTIIPWEQMSPGEVDRLLKRNSRDEAPSCYLFAAKVYMKLRRWNEAKVSLKKAEDLDPGMDGLQEALSSLRDGLAQDKMAQASKLLKGEDPALALFRLLEVEPEGLGDEALSKWKELRDAAEAHVTSRWAPRSLNATRSPDLPAIEVLGVDVLEDGPISVVMGCLQNLTLFDAKQVQLEISLRSVAGGTETKLSDTFESLGSGSVQKFSFLVPERGPFDVKVKAWRVQEAPKETVSASQTTEKPILEVKVVRAMKGDKKVTVICSVTNASDSPVQDAAILFTFCDADGQALVTRRCPLPPPNLAPGEKRTDTFEVDAWGEFKMIKAEPCP